MSTRSDHVEYAAGHVIEAVTVILSAPDYMSSVVVIPA